MSFRLAAAMLGDVLPLDRPVAPERVRGHLHAVATHEEARMAEEPHGGGLGLVGLPARPRRRVAAGRACARVRRWRLRAGQGGFLVRGGRGPVSGFRRDTPGDEPPRPAKCFAYVQAHDDCPRWTQAGAHLMLQVRTRVLNGELEDAFRRRWPGFRPLLRTGAVAEHASA